MSAAAKRTLAIVAGLVLVMGGLLGCSGSDSERGPITPARNFSSGPGLASSSDGYRLDNVRAAGNADMTGQPLSFQILGPDSKPVTAFDIKHDKQLHTVIVRSDTAVYRHVHPTLAPDGTWSLADWVWPTAGSYRIFADFTPSGGPGLTLSVPFEVSGPATQDPLPTAGRLAHVDGYDITLSGGLSTAGSMLSFSVARNGQPVTDLEQYLGAAGHLVVLRAHDLAYLHAHPVEGPMGPTIEFHTQAPSVGDYRLFLEFQHEGRVHVASFTQRSTEPGTSGSQGGHSGH